MMLEVIRKFLQGLIRGQMAAWLRIVLLLCFMLIYGTVAFVYFEGEQNPDLTWRDGLWYSVVTMTTVGYGDYFPKSSCGRLFVGAPLMFIGIGLLGYALSVVAATLVTAKSKELKGMGSFKMDGHLVIINFPGLAKVERLITELRHDSSVGKEAKVILIDEDLQELPPELISCGVSFVRGNPTRDETLVRANIDKARHAIVLCKTPGAPHSDSLNVTITLAIEARTKKIHTVVECLDPCTEELLKKAGCDRVVCISRFDAHFISQEMLNPGVQDVMDELLSNTFGQQIYLSPISVGPPGAQFTRLLAVCRENHHLAIGIRRGGSILLNLTPDFTVEENDHAITIGPKRVGSFALS
ncbi:MAG: NAD-binding protein [Deltaproteobacteria bacterium]|nr:NAD-binding protein [Deltaproteobacteria bacterium]